MNAPAFDTLHAAKRLRESGFADAQAEAVVATVHDAITGGVASKADLAELEAARKSDSVELEATFKSNMANLRAEFKSNMANLRAEFKSDLAELKSDIYKQLWIVAAFVVSAVVAAIKFLS